jgi:xanthine dehydrogenase accessory factor
MGSREFSAADADGHSMVVVATQGHGDEEVMEQAVAARPAYLGLVASQRRGAAVLGYLKDRGVPQDRLDRIKVPAGLNLGRTSHREIAVAILAELVQLRAAGEIGGGMGGPSVTSTGATGTTGAHAGHAERAAPAAGQRAASAPAVAAPAEAVDPVCGMTVVADDSSYPLVHDGVTYYFCRVGCRRAFEADPAAYVKKGTRC